MRIGCCESELPATLLSISEAACCLGVHPSTVRRWQKKGLLKSYTGGMHRRLSFRQSEVFNFSILNAFGEFNKHHQAAA